MKSRMAKWMLCLPLLLLAPEASPQMAFPTQKAAAGGVGLPGTEQAMKALKRVPRTLEEMLAFALRSNPDILVAESKVRQAQAELNQARLQVAQQVITLYDQREGQRLTVAAARETLKITEQRVAAGQAPSEEVSKAMVARIEAETKLAGAEAKLRYLLGIGGTLESVQAIRKEPTPPKTVKPPRRPDIPQEFKKPLETKIGLDAKELPLGEILTTLRGMQEDMAIVLDPDLDAEEILVTLQFPKPISLATALLAIHDQMPSLCFVFREYGLFVTTTDRAEEIMGATIPMEIPLTVEVPAAR